MSPFAGIIQIKFNRMISERQLFATIARRHPLQAQSSCRTPVFMWK